MACPNEIPACAGKTEGPPSGSSPVEPVHLKRRIFSIPTLLSLCLAGALLAALVTRFDVDLQRTWAEAKAASPWYLAAATATHYLTFIVRGARWRLLIQNVQGQGSRIPGVAYCSQLVLLGWFGNSVAGFRLGDAYRAYLYGSEQNTPFSRIVGTLLAERLLDTVLVVFLVLVSALFLAGTGSLIIWTVFGVSVALAAVLLALLLVIIWTRERASRILPSWLATRYQQLYEGVSISSGQMWSLNLWGLLGWFTEIGRLYLVSEALHLDIGFPLAMFLALANSLLTLTPTPGGLGAVEAGVAGLLVRLSTVSANSAAALVVLDRLIAYVLVIAIGAVLLLLRQAFPRVFQAQGSGNPAPVDSRLRGKDGRGPE